MGRVEVGSLSFAGLTGDRILHFTTYYSMILRSDSTDRIVGILIGVPDEVLVWAGIAITPSDSDRIERCCSNSDSVKEKSFRIGSLKICRSDVKHYNLPPHSPVMAINENRKKSLQIFYSFNVLERSNLLNPLSIIFPLADLSVAVVKWVIPARMLSYVTSGSQLRT
jgi:hypothetical protein